MLSNPRGLMASSGAASGYTILNSVYGDGTTGYFSRTPGASTNNRTWTVSCWIKLVDFVNRDGILFSQDSGVNYTALFFKESVDAQAYCLEFRNIEGTCSIITNALYRDTGAWMHVVCAVDTTQGTAANRVHIYVNGVEATYQSASYPAQNADTYWNNTFLHRILMYGSLSYDGLYLAEYNNIGGQQLTPSSFGETDGATGSWKPKAYSGTYGTNGFKLDFAASGDLGNDVSGNNNDFTKNGTITQTTDSPTDKTASNVGNYYVLNALDKATGVTLSVGNRKATNTSGNEMVRATYPIPQTGDWYWEITIGTLGSGGPPNVGIAKADHSLSQYLGQGSTGYGLDAQGRFWNNASQTTYTTFGAGDVLALRYNAGSLYIGKVSGGTITWMNSGTALVTGLTGDWFPAISFSAGDATINFGQVAISASSMPGSTTRPVTANLPAPTIKKASSHFNVVTYTGTGATLSLTGVGFQPDFVWIKNRDTAAYHHALFDSVRGATKYLYSSSTSAEQTAYSDTLTSFDSDGFSLGADASSLLVNQSAKTYVAWCWKAGGTASSNTSGSITSSVSANTTAGFSVVTYTGTGANATVGHGLGAVPKMIIVKNRTPIAFPGAEAWAVKHVGLSGAAYSIKLNTTAAQVSTASIWNSTDPTSSVFSVGTNTETNENTAPMVAYCFAEISGFSKFGSYTGNSSTDGPFVWCGFRPKFVLLKPTTIADSWTIYDTSRSAYNLSTVVLYPDTSGAQGTGYSLDIVSNGFKLRDTSSTNNSSGQTYIFAAFAEFPFGGASTTQGKAR